MRASIPQLSVARADVARIDVSEVTLGELQIERLIVSGATLGINAGQARLAGVTVTVTLDFQLVWRIGIDGPGPLDLMESGTDSLGGIDLPLAFGNAEIPALRDMRFEIPTLVASGTRAQADPVRGLGLRGVVAEGADVRDVAVPAQDFTLAGLGLDQLTVQDVSVPAATVQSAQVRGVRGQPLSLPALVLRGLALPAAAANDIVSGPLDIPLTRDPIDLLPGLDLGFFAAHLRIVPSARTHVDRMEMRGVQAGFSANAVEVRNVTVPYALSDVRLGDIGVTTLEIPAVTLA